MKRLHGTFAPTRVSKEIDLLVKLEGQHHVVPLLGGYRFEDNISLIFPYFHHKPFREYYQFMMEDEIQEYMRACDDN